MSQQSILGDSGESKADGQSIPVNSEGTETGQQGSLVDSGEPKADGQSIPVNSEGTETGRQGSLENGGGEVNEESADFVKDGYTDSQMKAIIEGVLFTMGKSVNKDDLAIALKTTPARAVELAEELKKEYESSDRGLAIIRLDNSFQMCTKEFCFEPLVRVAAHPKKPVLTEVVLETLSIIAYRQPVTKLEISKIRGVSSDHAVNKLVEYGLISEQGRLNAPGRPILFGTTEEFLRQFKMESLDDLPIPAPERIAEIQNEVAQEYPEEENAVSGEHAGSPYAEQEQVPV